MKKIQCAERHDWKQTADSLGFLFHTIDGEPYWDESAYYQFTLKQIEQDLEDPTTEIHNMCMDLVARVVQSEELLERLSIPASFYDMIRTSWLEGHPHLYGRMDFSYNGSGPAKLLELNYDTPTSLLTGLKGRLNRAVERGLSLKLVSLLILRQHHLLASLFHRRGLQPLTSFINLLS